MAVLRDYIKIKHGFAFKGDHISTIDNGTVLVTPGNFSISGGFKEEKCKFFDGEYPTDYVLKPGDLIVTMTDLSKAIDTLGYSALVPNSERTYLHNQRIGLVQIIDSERLDKHYLYWFMRTPYYKKTIAATSSGSTVHHTSPDRIMDVEIELPDLKKQRIIAIFMDNIESKINTNKQINKNLEQQAKTIFKSWFIDYDPFGHQKPNNWLVSTLGNISIMGAGGDKPQNVSQIKTDLYQYPIYSNGLSDEGLYGFTDKPKISEESVTVSARGTIGSVCLRHIPYVPIVRLVTLIPKTEIISAKYLYLWLKQLHITGTGTTQQQLTVPNFQKTEILIPSQDIVTIFTNMVEPIFEKIWENQSENEKLSSLRDTLLPKLMSGEIDVSRLKL